MFTLERSLISNVALAPSSKSSVTVTLAADLSTSSNCRNLFLNALEPFRATASVLLRVLTCLHKHDVWNSPYLQSYFEAKRVWRQRDLIRTLAFAVDGLANLEVRYSASCAAAAREEKLSCMSSSKTYPGTAGGPVDVVAFFNKGYCRKTGISHMYERGLLKIHIDEVIIRKRRGPTSPWWCLPRCPSSA